MFRTLKQKASSILLLITCLSFVSCQSIPWPSRDVERCVIKIDPIVVNGQDYWAGKCRCHSYRISQKEIGRVSESVDKPLEYCNRLVGFRPEEWTDYFVSWFEELQIWTRQNTKMIAEYFE